MYWGAKVRGGGGKAYMGGCLKNKKRSSLKIVSILSINYQLLKNIALSLQILDYI